MKHSKILILPLVLSLLGAGCSPSAMLPSGSAPTTPGQQAADSCSNQYFPFKQGTSITYKSVFSGNTSEYKVAVKPSAAGVHALEYTFTVRGQAYPMTQEFTCSGSDGGLVAKGQLDLSSAMTGRKFSYETESVEGIFMPKDLSVGKKWDTTYNVIVRTDDPQMKAMIDGKRQVTQIKSEVVGEETITVPAGTFKALKLKQDFNIEIDIGTRTTIKSSNFSWFVKDIGMVKSQTLNPDGSVGSTSEAIAIQR